MPEPEAPVTVAEAADHDVHRFERTDVVEANELVAAGVDLINADQLSMLRDYLLARGKKK